MPKPLESRRPRAGAERAARADEHPVAEDPADRLHQRQRLLHVEDHPRRRDGHERAQEEVLAVDLLPARLGDDALELLVLDRPPLLVDQGKESVPVYPHVQLLDAGGLDLHEVAEQPDELVVFPADHEPIHRAVHDLLELGVVVLELEADEPLQDELVVVLQIAEDPGQDPIAPRNPDREPARLLRLLQDGHGLAEDVPPLLLGEAGVPAAQQPLEHLPGDHVQDEVGDDVGHVITEEPALALAVAGGRLLELAVQEGIEAPVRLEEADGQALAVEEPQLMPEIGADRRGRLGRADGDDFHTVSLPSPSLLYVGPSRAIRLGRKAMVGPLSCRAKSRREVHREGKKRNRPAPVFLFLAMVGKRGIEPPTSTMSTWHSSQLSYFPASVDPFYHGAGRLSSDAGAHQRS